MARKAQVTDLEASLESLENLVERMESGELSLEESLKAFEEGVRLTRQCQQSLEQAEQQVRVLLEHSEDAEPEPFETPDADTGADDDD